MPLTSKHLKWLVNTGQKLKSADGKDVTVLELNHQQDEEILSAWANHFRNHYCPDEEIDFLRQGTGLSRKEYLNQIKFPDATIAPGPSIRSGDFGEILVADYLQYALKYWVPRTRYGNKTVRNESTKGSDILGFQFVKAGQESPDDILAVFEAKAALTGKTSTNKLQEAVQDSAKDVTRKAESLNALKQRLIDKNQIRAALQVERFQNSEDHPYKEISGAAALFSNACYIPTHASKTIISEHPNKSNLMLVIILGDNMMNLVHELYRRAADEA
jgi:hypothetical protein